MNLNNTKTSRQLEGFEKFKSAGLRGIYHYPTGFGKTYAAMIAYDKLFSDDDTDLLIIVPSLGVYKVWNDAVVEFSKLKNREVKATIRTIHEEINNPIDKSKFFMVIVDEYHKFTSEFRIAYLKVLFSEIKIVLCLTATPAFKSKSFQELYIPVVDYITEKEAIANNWISQFAEYNIALEFSSVDKVRYKKFTDSISETLDLFRDCKNLFKYDNGRLMFASDFDVITACYTGTTVRDGNNIPIRINNDRIIESLANRKGWKRDLNLTMEYNRMLNTYWNPNTISSNVKTFMNLVRNRNELLINNVVKLQAIVKLFNSQPVPTIIFNESTQFADNIADAIGNRAIVYHSNVKSRPVFDHSIGDYPRYKGGAKKGQPIMFGKDRLRERALESIKTGEYLALVSAKALDEGIDIPNIEQVITSAGSANPMNYAQRSGRGKRVDIYNPDKVTKIYNFYFDDFVFDEKPIRSRDKEKLILRQSGSTNVIWVNEIDDII